MTFRDPMDGSDDDAPVYCDHGVDLSHDDCPQCFDEANAGPVVEEPADPDPFW